MSSVGDHRVKQKKCFVCGTSIPATAIYCTHCDHYQSYFRRFLTGVDLSGLTALVSSGALAFTFVHAHLPFQSASITARAIQCDSQKFTLAIDNSGSIPAIITNISATRQSKHKEYNQTVSLSPMDNPNLVFKPGEFRMVSYGPRPEAQFSAIPGGVDQCFILQVGASAFERPDRTVESAQTRSESTLGGFIRCASCT
jgi:hypothetical protein